MFKEKQVDFIIADVKVCFDFFTGTFVKVFARETCSSRVRVFDVPIRKLHVMPLDCDGFGVYKFGTLRRLYVSPIVFGSLRFERRK